MPRQILPLVPERLAFVQVQRAPDHIVIVAVPRTASASCPACRGRLHGASMAIYERTLSDLPWQGRPVQLRVRLRRLTCCNTACPRRTFGESVREIARPWARRCERLRDLQRYLGLALGGEAAARLAARLAMPVSADTLLRLVRCAPLPSRDAPRVVGLDEWAWRRGRRYGTMIVDLERNTIVDLLPDRNTETVAGWLRRHPSVEIGARDRAGVFAEGVRVGAPDATQIADRWHLLCNLSAALQAIVAGHHVAIRATARAILDERLGSILGEAAASRPPTAAERHQQTRHAPRQARYAELTRLVAAGASVAGVARSLGMD